MTPSTLAAAIEAAFPALPSASHAAGVLTWHVASVDITLTVEAPHTVTIETGTIKARLAGPDPVATLRAAIDHTHLRLLRATEAALSDTATLASLLTVSTEDIDHRYLTQQAANLERIAALTENAALQMRAAARDLRARAEDAMATEAARACLPGLRDPKAPHRITMLRQLAANGRSTVDGSRARWLSEHGLVTVDRVAYSRPSTRARAQKYRTDATLTPTGHRALELLDSETP